jgi:hypothetical protein
MEAVEGYTSDCRRRCAWVIINKEKYNVLVEQQNFRSSKIEK